jgi:hypothetical protein
MRGTLDLGSKQAGLQVMPFKHNACRRHRIGKMKFKATNWADDEAS